MESERADEAEKQNETLKTELKSLQPSKREKAAAAMGGMMSMFNRGNSQPVDEGLAESVEDMRETPSITVLMTEEKAPSREGSSNASDSVAKQLMADINFLKSTIVTRYADELAHNDDCLMQ